MDVFGNNFLWSSKLSKDIMGVNCTNSLMYQSNKLMSPMTNC